jgi:hypothetical protein
MEPVPAAILGNCGLTTAKTAARLGIKPLKRNGNDMYHLF